MSDLTEFALNWGWVGAIIAEFAPVIDAALAHAGVTRAEVEHV